jgi:hypothetical protein
MLALPIGTPAKGDVGSTLVRSDGTKIASQYFLTSKPSRNRDGIATKRNAFHSRALVEIGLENLSQVFALPHGTMTSRV